MQKKTRFEKDLEKARDRVENAEKQVLAVPSFAAPVEDTSRTAAPTGLLTVEEFKRKREQMVAEKLRARQRDEQCERQLVKRAKAQNKARLSFQEDDEEDNHEGDNNDGGGGGEDPRIVGKDPTVDSSFLPDRAREHEEGKLRELLALQWEEEQKRVRMEPMVVTFSFWDGKGHRRAQRCLKGATVGEFLAQIKGGIEEIQDVSTSNLLFIKEDMIIPHHFTFHELITTQARGRTGGALFVFESLVDEDRDKLDSHTAKVCERRWYDQNRHIFPASRWAIYEPK